MTEELVELLLNIARSLDEAPPKIVNEPTEPSKPPSVHGTGTRPGDDYNRRGDVAGVLRARGWQMVRDLGDGVSQWRRPGKDAKEGISATLGKCKGDDGTALFYVFSTNGAPFEPETAYGPFAVYTILEHGGDYSAAAKKLGEDGFGEQIERCTIKGGEVPVVVAVNLNEEPKGELTPGDVAMIADLRKAGAQTKWVWNQWIQSNVLNIIAAEGGTGKTRFVADLVRRIRHGLPWPDGQKMTLDPMTPVLWVVSDNHHDEMVTLAESFDIEDVLYINATKADPYGGVTLDSPVDIAEMELRIKAIKPAFVVIDTVGNSTDRNLSRQEDAKAYYQPLQLVARRRGVPILCLTHLNAGGKVLGRRAVEKVRIVMQMDMPNCDDHRRRLWIQKSNNKYPRAMGITMHDGKNEYDFEPPIPTDPNAPQIITGNQNDDSELTAIDRIIKALTGIGWQTAKDIAEAIGISVQKMKTRLDKMCRQHEPLIEAAPMRDEQNKPVTKYRVIALDD